jgi:Holliday junction DNA helicase RuvA
MYQYLKGVLVEKDLIHKTLVIEQGGIAYLIQTNLRTMNNLEVNSNVKVFLKAIIKEEEIKLFGFADKANKEMYEHLQSVSGVGPKSAMNILDALDIQDIISAVLNDKPKLLSAAQGIGLKTAQRIVLELNTKLHKFNIHHQVQTETKEGAYKCIDEVTGILVNLGFSEIEAYNKIRAAKASHIEDSSELVVRFCLQSG